MTDKIIELKDVWKIYQMGETQVKALRGLNLKVKKGDFLIVNGPSGSGKSTAMNMIGALDVPTKGQIFLDGEDISTLHESDLAQIRGKKVGFIFQQFNLIPTLTALENVMLPLIFQGVPREKRIKRATKLLKRVGLGERTNHKPTELSGGQQQRVSIARALVNDPEMVLADEPTGNLDTKTGKEVMNLLKELHKKEGKTIVLVTHDLHLIRYGDKVLELEDGQIKEEKER